MKLPRDVSGTDLVKALHRVGYRVTRQTGSHIRLTREGEGARQHHITIPNHSPLRVGTLSAIITDVATHLRISKDEAIKYLFG
ncbi:YcfA family protein [Nitrosococcus halophilus Nc 4]|uniref:YcfA family protein n=1 Tax=Nitrosococcus halophilus (strain Nc4) TaxID=472759 RepID=D5C3Y7_NITHN|nr:type II toxin-antitoxin system HicA family toxin [Nitrosococcus halophilus]ADE16924.1 YcfA family protein [Nitrosococcus halophilus Nc 4]